jgi:hypothetical protein
VWQNLCRGLTSEQVSSLFGEKCEAHACLLIIIMLALVSASITRSPWSTWLGLSKLFEYCEPLDDQQVIWERTSSASSLCAPTWHGFYVRVSLEQQWREEERGGEKPWFLWKMKRSRERSTR